MIGTGTSLDGLPPDVSKILPDNLKELILHLLRNIFKGKYPRDWRNQLLFPIAKKGHTKENPSLRGIAIGPLLSRLYDHILNTRFCEWYTPNKEQAGYRKGQGCVIQLFSLFLLIENSRRINKDILLGLLDFAKAFDYTNRYLLVKDLMNEGIGKQFVKAIVEMYQQTAYIPKSQTILLENQYPVLMASLKGEKRLRIYSPSTYPICIIVSTTSTSMIIWILIV